jgi:hypothetical protein
MAKAVTLMKDLRAAINEIDVNQDFKTRVEVIKTVGETLKTASEIKPDQIKPAKDFIDSSKQYYQAQATSKAADQDALVQALSKIIRPEKTAGTSEADKPVMIQIKLDDGSILTGKGKLFSGGKA